MAVSSSNFISVIEKVDGRENFSTWKFAVQSYLEHEGLWACVLGTDRDPVKVTKARTKIVLLVKPINYVHIEECTTAKEVWDKLLATFADTGLMRRVSLIKTLTTTQLENCQDIEVYVNTIISAARKLHGIGCRVDDSWLATFLLAGLSDMYRPVIMAIESSGAPLTSDFIKNKLLQEVKNSDYQSSSSQAFYTMKRGPRCYVCNDYGHIAIHCTKNQSVSSKVTTSEQHAKVIPTERTGTGFFCSCVAHRSNQFWLSK